MFYTLMIQRLIPTPQDREKIQSAGINPADLADDFFDYTKVVIKKPWGKEYLIYQNGEAALWILHMDKGAKTSMHCHPNKKTALVVLSGSVRCRTLASDNIFAAGQGSLIEKGVFHSSEALDGNVVVMELETPTNKRDLVRLDDAYGRSGKGYEGASHHLPLDDSLCHFHKEDDRYHCEKQFGDCGLIVANFANEEEFRRKISPPSADIVVVLGGNILAAHKNIELAVGDILIRKEFEEYAGNCRVKAGELLLIKKLT